LENPKYSGNLFFSIFKKSILIFLSNGDCNTSEPAGRNSLNYNSHFGGPAMNKEVKNILNQVLPEL
jgi:hypothetical protein